ncbi:MAG: hypothetical protein M1833_003055 [Piccolia ochrophora]|nr:MAG: hypothetical protein M1833_003055 [Piccolia ochrophora]
MQGFNMGRYVPPDLEGTTTGNKLAGKHALGSRAKKLPQGILTVRFEMPFAVWCTTCPKPTIIGQGVRFNAEKKKVGNYHTTPIYSFRMRHVACGGAIEIRTDPQNTAYVVTEGGKKRDTGEDKVLEGEIVIQTEEERAKAREDAFVSLEGKVQDKRQAATEHGRVEELIEIKEKDWADPYERNRKIRRTFRAERKAREKEAERGEELKNKMSLGIELLQETDDDKQRAGFVDFGATGVDEAVDKARAKPLFGGAESSPKNSKEAKSGSKRSARRRAAQERAEKTAILGQEIRGNTRVAMDPFLVSNRDWGPVGSANCNVFAVIKRKTLEEGGTIDGEEHTGALQRSSGQDSLGLAGYDSE